MRQAEERGLTGGLSQWCQMAAELAADAGDTEAALAHIERSRDRGPNGIFARANVLLAAGDVDGARSLLEDMLEQCEAGAQRWNSLKAAVLHARIALDEQSPLDAARDHLERSYRGVDHELELPLLQQARELLTRLA